jgi:hypothetical protein
MPRLAPVINTLGTIGHPTVTSHGSFEDELERRVGSVLPRHSLVQLTDALTRLRAGEQSGRASLAA